MLKKNKKSEELEEEEFEGMEEEELEEEEREMLEKRTLKKKQIKKKGKDVPTQRFVAFNQPGRIGIADAETGEAVAEGEFAVLQALAKITSQLENIENNLGSMMES